MHNKLTYRFIEQKDLPALLKLHNSKNDFFGQELSLEKKLDYVSKIRLIFNDPQYIAAGSFDEDNKLISAMGGYFYEDFPFWYSHGQVSALKIDSWALAEESWIIFHAVAKVLMNYAEQKKYFGFYSRIFERKYWINFKMHQRQMRKGLETKYETFLEEIYLPGESCRRQPHQFFFGAEPWFDETSFITLSLMKPEYRLEFFKLNSRQNIRS